MMGQFPSQKDISECLASMKSRNPRKLNLSDILRASYACICNSSPNSQILNRHKSRQRLFSPPSKQTKLITNLLTRHLNFGRRSNCGMTANRVRLIQISQLIQKCTQILKLLCPHSSRGSRFGHRMSLNIPNYSQTAILYHSLYNQSLQSSELYI